MSNPVIINVPNGMEPEDTQASGPAKPNLAHKLSGGPRSYKAEPAEVRSKIYSQLGQGVPSVDQCRQEIDGYYAVFMGRIDLTEINRTTDLLEFATAVLARLNEMELLILRAENDMQTGFNRGSQFNRFRTGELRAAQDTARKMVELGSRRLSYAQMIEGMRYQP